MIHTFSASNFYSFDDEITIDFRVDDNAPDNESYCTTASGTRLSLVQAVVGPNASGKTTALKALAFVHWFMANSFRQNHRGLPVQPFAGNKDKDLPIKISVEFETDKGLHIYKVELSKTRLLKEELFIRSLTSKRVTSKKLFSRTWNSESKSYDLEDNGFNLPEDYWTSAELGNTSIIAASFKFGHKYAKHLIKYWKQFETNVEVDDRFMHYRFGAYHALEYYSSHKDSKLRAEEDVRRYADLGIESFGKNGMMSHRFGDKTIELDFEHESSGTQRFLEIRRLMDAALDKGGMVVVDEFDAFLHPQMSVSLVEKFLNRKTNSGCAQLLFSAHELLILKLLDKYQLNFAKKNDRGATNLWRLDSQRGVRSDENIISKYTQGVYGAWPEISDPA